MSWAFPLTTHNYYRCCFSLAAAKITVEDPEAMTLARRVAIVHVCAESMGILFCRAWGCYWAALLAIPSSSMVACCCKQRWTYLMWSCVGGFAFFFHASAAVTEALGDKETGHDYRGFLCSVQVVLCLICLPVVNYGRGLASQLRDSVSPIGNMQAGRMGVTTQPMPYAQAGLSP